MTTKTVDLWIGIDDLLPRRAVVKLGYAGGVTALSALRKLTVDLTVSFTKHGETVAITAPSTTNVLDLARLRGLASQ